MGKLDMQFSWGWCISQEYCMSCFYMFQVWDGRQSEILSVGYRNWVDETKICVFFPYDLSFSRKSSETLFQPVPRKAKSSEKKKNRQSLDAGHRTWKFSKEAIMAFLGLFSWWSRWWQLKYFFMFTLNLGEMIQFDDRIFQMGWNHQQVIVFLCISLGINRHILSWWARGLQSPSKRIVIRFHYHSQKVIGSLGYTMVNYYVPPLFLREYVWNLFPKHPKNPDPSLEQDWWSKSQSQNRIVDIIPFFYIPGTQMTLVLIGKDLVLKGSITKIEDKQVPGRYIFIHTQYWN